MKSTRVILGIIITQTLMFGAEIEKLDSVVVEGNTIKGVKTEQDLKDILVEVPGGTNLININKITSSKASISKVLNYEPGIIVQEFFGGNDQPRINIRGSGIQDNPVNRGIQLLYDGLALNHPDGSFIIGMLDPEQADFLSIYRGSNAMRYGATTLGGALDLNVRTALNSPTNVGVEMGSYGYKKARVTFGDVQDKWDYFLYATHSQQDGFRVQSEGKRDSLALNVGYRGDSWDNRTYLNYTKNKFDIPFLLRKREVKENPKTVMGPDQGSIGELLNIRLRKPKRDSKEVRVANKTHIVTRSTEQTFGVYASKAKDKFKNPVTLMDTDITNYGLDYDLSYDHLSKNSYLTNYLLFVSLNGGKMPRTYESIHPTTGNVLQEIADVNLKASNAIIGGQVLQDITADFKALASVQWVLNKRKIIDRKNDGVLDSTFSYSVLNPKIGVIYEPNFKTRFYANYSKSSEAPNFWQLATVEANPADPLNDYLQINNLKMQKADTYEVGMNVHLQDFGFSLAGYYSKVQKELISVVGNFAVNGKTINYEGTTIHKGVELGGDFAFDGIFSDSDKITGKLIYNFSYFTFKTGEYAGNKIAGVPVHLIEAKLGYWANSKWYVGTNMRLQPKSTYIDHENSTNVEQDAFYLFGLETSYNATRGLRLYLDLNNITDEVYETAYVVRGLSAPDNPNFIPGAGFNLSAGFEYNF